MQKFALSLCLFLCAFFSHAQNLETKLTDNLDYFRENYPFEKVHLQTDRSYYSVGETVWMKTWVTHEGKPSFLSKILYVELADQNNKLIEKKMYKLDSMSTTSGDFNLPKDLATGNYRIHAYTLWMKNFPDYIFHSDIFVYGKQSGSSNTTGAASLNDITVNFFPEGGELVNDLESVVAFKIYMKNNGKGVNAKGVIKDQSGNIVTSFATTHNGMGSFKLKPESGKTYTAALQSGSGSEMSFKLPAPLSGGLVMKVNNSNPNRISLLLRKTSNDSHTKVLLTAQMHNVIVFQAPVEFSSENTAGAAIPKKNLPPGILQLTVFDTSGIALSERLVFIKNLNIQDVQINTSGITNTKRQKNSVEINFPTETTRSVSAVITDAATDTVSDPANILSSVFLASDLKGMIESPNYYFKANDSTTNANLDQLMMTQGWRKFDWKNVVAKKFPELKYPVESSISIRGSVTKPGSKSVITEGKVDLLLKGADSTTLIATADITDKGEFIVPDLNFRNSAVISYQGTNAKRQNVVVDVNIYPNYIDSVKNVSYKPGYSNSSLKSLNDELSKLLAMHAYGLDTSGNYLGNVTVKTKKIAKIDSLNNEYATGQFEFNGRRLDPTNTAYFSLWQFIRNVPGFVIEGDMKNPTVSLSRSAGINVFSDNGSSTDGATFDNGSGDASAALAQYVENGIAFYLNEVPVTRDVLDNISMTDVAYVKTFVGPESAAIGPFNGVIAVYTKKGVGVGSSVLDKVFAKRNILGYSTPRIYSPLENFSPESKDADNRVLLYWNANVTTDKSNKAVIKFFNSDKTDKRKLIIQGIDKNGQIIYKEQILQ